MKELPVLPAETRRLLAPFWAAQEERAPGGRPRNGSFPAGNGAPEHQKPMPIASLSLFFEKFCPVLVDTANWHQPKGIEKKGDFYRHLIRYRSPDMETYIQDCSSRRHRLLHRLKMQGYQWRYLKAETTWNLIVGIGNAHVLETGLTLNRMYGFPYLPGSTVKGLTRYFASMALAAELAIPTDDEVVGKLWLEILEIPEEQRRRQRLRKLIAQATAGGSEAPDEPADSSEAAMAATVARWDEKVHLFQRVFGVLGQKGAVIFFDALPEVKQNERLPLVVDIVNPHYGPYYVGNDQPAPPADYYHPKPVQFLCVGPKACFRFYVATTDPELLAQVIDSTKGWLPRALGTWGIGAKTRSGYGQMQILDAPVHKGGRRNGGRHE
ncbi:type III-B CRISPR module RAMP protein Cmr6 [Heliophilum fasciatum]|uniref:CRISPR-associated protein Cmr6 n=1 Tax=Heliophilum fasciatum TaxID=35700 RepID=A0A4R2RAJ7_9FIRM|nr:type III-B CRISPR module RAMP protein Cmr6 [Heliophilum fasciatum]MCW2279329.1 CRISPR-associated protein Cmr6 [Heliophilum fasciatum]TCP60310.1 CRISPR-associated protein Cmr6 [Heliophilum fasciatum]